VIRNLAKLTYPFTSCLLVPSVCDVGPYEAKKIGYDGYMKLAYLHPNSFTPDRSIIVQYHLPEKYVLVRLAKLSAHHDVGINGLNLILTEHILSKAKQFGYPVYITSETDLDASLQPYQLRIQYKDIHHVLAFASLLISDSQSMSVEAAMLGVPSIRFSDFSGRISVLEELEQRYQLTFGIPTQDPNRLITLFDELLSNINLREVFQQRRQKMLSEKIDVTAFLTWFIENYPESRGLVKKEKEVYLCNPN